MNTTPKTAKVQLPIFNYWNVIFHFCFWLNKNLDFGYGVFCFRASLYSSCLYMTVNVEYWQISVSILNSLSFYSGGCERAVLSGCVESSSLSPACSPGCHPEEEDRSLLGSSGASHMAAVSQDGWKRVLWWATRALKSLKRPSQFLDGKCSKSLLL